MTWDTRFVATNVYFDFHAHGYTRSVFLMDDVHGAVIAKRRSASARSCGT